MSGREEWQLAKSSSSSSSLSESQLQPPGGQCGEKQEISSFGGAFETTCGRTPLAERGANGGPACLVSYRACVVRSFLFLFGSGCQDCHLVSSHMLAIDASSISDSVDNSRDQRHDAILVQLCLPSLIIIINRHQASLAVTRDTNF